MEKKRKIAGFCLILALIIAGGIYSSTVFGGKADPEVVLLNGDGKKLEDPKYPKDTSGELSEITLRNDKEVSKENISEQDLLLEAVIHVCGEVNNPGVYTLSEKARVVDAIEAAGGFTKEAAEDAFNQAALITDGQRIYVPNKKEVETLSDVEIAEVVFSNPTGKEKNDESSNKTKVNINKATKEELMTIPGIGEAKALSIISYRTEHGLFSTIEELQNISGIKSAVFNRMKDFITVGK
ncbi:helix-hairpin-helix domain-containing protein [Lachnoclostridium phytofermentans]|uniref:Competence protein ComEA helix-hairpin-helix repeat protein n=1 Tax=Lachnoclostridium phytofermentans (strain ATCC 700394 / DSM 18823 / ISDg) TaxID=357809 RepID=A9KHN6_LACP7|nr:helix-hairpin-helix domain-containing protein [Lachnoclostridium phytofermentans]ABX42321.1 competence protein ComEA helix-hairpin-helix repeat protein [Lachnoclostridium phytofermentans ISDg]